MLLLDVVLRGTPAFGGVRIPGSVAHIEIGLGGNMARRREPDRSEVRRELETSRPSFPFFLFFLNGNSALCNSASGAKKLFPRSRQLTLFNKLTRRVRMNPISSRH